jgi:hypothetical protein
MSARALEASGYQLMSWGEETHEGKDRIPLSLEIREGIHSRRYTVSLVYRTTESAKEESSHHGFDLLWHRVLLPALQER